MRAIFAGLVMLAVSCAAVHARDAGPLAQDRLNANDAVQSETDAVGRLIEQENERLDRALKGICRGC